MYSAKKTKQKKKKKLVGQYWHADNSSRLSTLEVSCERMRGEIMLPSCSASARETNLTRLRLACTCIYTVLKLLYFIYFLIILKMSL